ncbi:DUF3592 domain-containing protein [Vibrio quintilis]|uniref:Inner membrane protein YmfA n=1 Tax=Vibrio quintilis TaxID=1117707 RepID=A0A1M7YWC6_9VIBR|nr:DUF3592 domain-containing protein [Vibrio quintilis]SHO56934.1 Inner membrane protein YmfA [Vibrio quintilis]
MKPSSIFKLAFMAFGLVFLALAAFLFHQQQSFLNHSVRTDGTVIAFISDGTYYPVVSFQTTEGEMIEFKSSTGSNPPSFSRGENVEVVYRPDLPEHAEIYSFFHLWLGPLIFGILGGLFFLTGVGFFIFSLFGNRKKNYLKQHGTPVTARFQQVEMNTSLELNGRHPYVIIAQWQNPQTSQLHVFKSENLWFDPTDIITDELTVLIEPGNPAKYYMNIPGQPETH